MFMNDAGHKKPLLSALNPDKFPAYGSALGFKGRVSGVGCFLAGTQTGILRQVEGGLKFDAVNF